VAVGAVSIRIELADTDTAARIVDALRGTAPATPEDQAEREQLADALSQALVTRLIGATRHPLTSRERTAR
jgi:hypothetical protein